MQVTAQIQMVGTTRRNSDTDAGAVDIGNGMNRGYRRDQVGAFDQQIRRGERDLVGSSRFHREKRRVPSMRLQRRGHFPSRVKSDSFHRQLTSASQFQRQVNRNTA